MWKYAVLLLLALPPVVNSKVIPIPTTLHTSSPTSSTTSLGMCAVCLDKDCAIGVREIYPADSNIAVWVKANSGTGIQNCSMENLKADAPCKMANGSLVQLADNPLQFDGIDTYDVRRKFNSQILPCAELNLPPKPSLDIIIGSVIGIFIIFIISIGVLIWKRNSRGQGQDRDHRHGKNGVPPHYAEDRDEIIKKQPLKEEILNGNFNGEDDSVGTAGVNLFIDSAVLHNHPE